MLTDSDRRLLIFAAPDYDKSGWLSVKETLGLPFPNVSDGRPLNPLHPYISLHILHSFLYTFVMMLTRRICQLIKSFFS